MKKFLSLLFGLVALSPQLSAQVVIPWSDVSKTGAVPGDVGAAALSHTHTVSQLSDASANGRSLIAAVNYAAMKSLLGFTAADIGDASANGRSLLQASDFATMRSLLGYGSAASLDAPASGNASSTQVVKGSDTRLTDTRTPTDDTVSTAKLQANAVTNAKAAQMAAHTIKGNNTGSAANAADLTIAQLKTELGVSTTSTANAIPQLGSDGKFDVAMIPTDNIAITFRHGTDAERQTITPAAAEPIFTDDLHELWFGDGTTVGGVRVTQNPLAGLKLTYTGAFQRPLVLGIMPNAVYLGLFGLTGTGSPVEYKPAAGLTINDFAYSEISTQPDRLLTISLDNLVYIAGSNNYTASYGFSISSCSSLASIALPALKYVRGSFGGALLPALTSFSAPALVAVDGLVSFGAMAGLTTLDLSALQFVGDGANGLSLGTNAVVSLNLGALIVVHGPISILNQNSETAITLTNLQRVGGNFSYDTGLITSFSVPALTYVSGTFQVANCSSLTTVSAPSVVQWGGTIFLNTGNGNIANVTLGTVGTLKKLNGNVTLTGQKLTSTSVNALLALLVSLDGTNGTTAWGSGKTVNLSGGTSAGPSGQGATDKSTLQGRGATVTTN